MCRGGGKGALIQVEKSGTLGCGNDQTIFCMGTGQAGAEILENASQTLMAGHDHPILCLMDQGGSVMETILDKAGTLRAQEHGHQPIILTFPDGVAHALLAKGNLSNREDQDTLILQLYENHAQDSRVTGPLDTAPTVAQKFGTGGNNTPLILYVGGFSSSMGAKAGNIGFEAERSPTLSAERHDATVVLAVRQNGSGECRTGQVVGALSTNSNASGRNAPLVLAVDCRHGTVDQDVNGALQAKSSGGQSLNLNNVALTVSEDGTILLTGQPCVVVKVLVRRLTPMECERLQGYPDKWTDIGQWVDSKCKLHKESSDSARYKALGNSIALPPWKWVLKRLCAQYERDATMASLFDGIAGFPYLWEQLNGEGSCLWASEIDEFPMAVSKYRMGG